MNQTHSRSSETAQELVITRVFDAPRELVWRAWTDPKHSMGWWGPKGFTAPFCTIDLRVGGRWHSCMRSPDGTDYWGLGVYKEIAPPEKLVCTIYFSNEAGDVVSPTDYGFDPEWPQETVFEITFEELGAKTKLTLRQIGVTLAMAESVGAVKGWNESFDKLAEELNTAM